MSISALSLSVLFLLFLFEGNPEIECRPKNWNINNPKFILIYHPIFSTSGKQWVQKNLLDDYPSQVSGFSRGRWAKRSMKGFWHIRHHKSSSFVCIIIYISLSFTHSVLILQKSNSSYFASQIWFLYKHFRSQILDVIKVFQIMSSWIHCNSITIFFLVFNICIAWFQETSDALLIYLVKILIS